MRLRGEIRGLCVFWDGGRETPQIGCANSGHWSEDARNGPLPDELLTGIREVGANGRIFGLLPVYRFPR